MAEKNPEKIEVDKDFLMNILKVVEEFRKDLNLIKQGGFKIETSKVEEAPAPLPSQPAGTPPSQDTIFQVMETMSIAKLPPTPEEAMLYIQRSEEFRKKLEALMRDYKIMQISAQFLKKL